MSSLEMIYLDFTETTSGALSENGLYESKDLQQRSIEHISGRKPLTASTCIHCSRQQSVLVPFGIGHWEVRRLLGLLNLYHHFNVFMPRVQNNSRPSANF